MKHPKLNSILAVAAIAMVLGCTSGSTGSGSTATGGSSEGKPIKLAFVTNNPSDFWTIARKGVEKADAELSNVTVEFKMPANGTAAEQKEIVDTLVASGVDGIAISPNDPANQTDMLNAVAKQAILVTQDSDAPTSDRLCYVGTDNKAAGVQAGEELKKVLPDGGKIMIFVGKTDAQNAHDRIEGLKEAIAGTKIEVVDIRTDETDRARAKSNVSDTLVKYPDIAGLVGIWSYNGPAILNATREAGKIGKIKIVCFDEEDETLAGVEAGDISATVVQQPYEFGYQSVKLMAEYKEGKKDVVPANKMKIVPTLVIDKAKVAEFKTKLNELRGRG